MLSIRPGCCFAQATLGETLDGTPGISSTYFGPNASRPVIRGLDGDRIRILNNGGAVADASSLSYDHAVTVDPLSIERIEVLRGPGALQYGGSAVGGVVNVIDNRIAREALFDAQGGITGKVDLGLASGNAEQGGGFLLEAGNNHYALHADVFNRSTGDVAVPVTLACSKPGAPGLVNKICNSASDTRGAAVGSSVFSTRVIWAPRSAAFKATTVRWPKTLSPSACRLTGSPWRAKCAA
jgi:iron complex outermembrane receptor protein